MSLSCVEVETDVSPVGSVIWLHGLGADGHDFEPIVPELRLPDSLALRFVFPHATVRPVTLNGGVAMRAWFDITSLDRYGPVDEAGIDASCAAVDELIDREIARGVPRNRIVIAGFSQGGVIALHTVLRAQQPVRALMVLSSYLPMVARLADYPRHNKLPVFLAHGDFDPVLPLALGEDIRRHLDEAGYAPEWHSYPMAHGVCPEEIAHISAWLQSVFD
ncbi:MAG: alpha/beta hydrolase fold domain-containing protein [Pseudomonadota bacterium]